MEAVSEKLTSSISWLKAAVKSNINKRVNVDFIIIGFIWCTKDSTTIKPKTLLYAIALLLSS